MQPPLPPTAMGARNFGQDNMTGFSQSFNSTAQITNMPSVAFPSDPFSFPGPNSQYKTTEDSEFYYKPYPLKVAPTTDGSTIKMGRGELCYSCYTQEDLSEGNDIYTVFTNYRLNQGCFQRARKIALEDTLGYYPDSQESKRARGALSGPNNTLQADRYIKLFPRNVEEFKEHYNWAGVLQNKIPTDVADLRYKGGYDPNVENMFRLVSMAAGGEVEIACLVRENIKVSKTIFEVGAMVDTEVPRVYDVRGRNLGTHLVVPAFKLFYVCTEDDSMPSAAQYAREVDEVVELITPNTDPLTGAPLPFVEPPTPYKMRVKSVPYLRPLGKVTKCECPIPTASEIQNALVDSDKYKHLLTDCPIRVKLLTQGWGPFNMRQ